MVVTERSMRRTIQEKGTGRCLPGTHTVLPRGAVEWIQARKAGVEQGLQLSREGGCSEQRQQCDQTLRDGTWLGAFRGCGATRCGSRRTREAKRKAKD